MSNLDLLVNDHIYLHISHLCHYLLERDCVDFLESFENLYDDNEDLQEIFEYWAVSEWLYENLKEQGEPVGEFLNLYIWGRGSCGQAIYLDGVMSRIFKGK